VSEPVVIDDATIIMRSRFLSGSQRIFSHLSWLEAHAEEIPPELRGSLGATAEKIKAALKRLTDEMDRLPEAQWERFKAMLMLLRAQQDALDSAEALIERARANAVSVKRPAQHAAATRGVASISGGPRHLVAVALDAASPRLVLVGVIAAGLIGGYVIFTRDGNRHEIATKGGAPPIRDIGGPVAPGAASREGAAAKASYDMPATPSPPSEGPRAAKAVSITTNSITSPSPGLAARTVPSPLPSAPVTDRPDTAAIARGTNDSFVPVVFTGKDQAVVFRTFATLQNRYPTLLSPRRAETQPVDLGQKGIWHRLVILPPGPRQTALNFCDQLLAVGYDQCWVKGY
jgi:hypothetical protein